MKFRILTIPVLLLLSLLSSCSDDGANKEKKKRNLYAILLLPTPYDPDQAILDAIDADIVNPGPLNMALKNVNLITTEPLSIGKHYKFTVSINSDYDAKNVLVRFIFINKAQLDSGLTTNLTQFEIMDRIPYIYKGNREYTINVPIPDAGPDHSGQYAIFSILDTENRRENYFQQSGMLSGVNKTPIGFVNVNGSTSGTRDLFIERLRLGNPVTVLKTAQNNTDSIISASMEIFSGGLDSQSIDVAFGFADLNGNKLPALGNLYLINGNGGTSPLYRVNSLRADVKANGNVFLVPESNTTLLAIKNYIESNGEKSLKLYAEVNPSGTLSEINAPGGATSNIAFVEIPIALDASPKNVGVTGEAITGHYDKSQSFHSSINSAPLKEYSIGFGTGTLGDKDLFALDFDFNAYAKMLKNTTVIAHAEAKSNIYMFSAIERTLFTAYAHGELIPIRMKDSFIDAEVKVMSDFSGGMTTVYKLKETGAKSFYWYTTRYKEKRLVKRVFVHGVPVRLTGVLAGILLSTNKSQLSNCDINSCQPDSFREGFSQENYKDYSVAQFHFKNNFVANANPRILIRGFGQGKPETGLTMGVEGQVTVLDIFPVATGTATVRMINNAYQVEIEFNEILDISFEYGYGKIEFFIEIPYPKVSFWDASIEYYRKYWTLVSWDAIGDFKTRVFDVSQFLRIHLYTGEVNFTY
jgi:hypothetical protein